MQTEKEIPDGKEMIKMPIGNPQYPDFWEVHQAEWESWMSFMEEELEREKEDAA